jgi:hypothetical protein
MKGGSQMPKQGKGKEAKAEQHKGIHVGIHFHEAVVPEDACETLSEHLKSLVPELVRGLKERTGKEDLGQFDLNKEMAPDLGRGHKVLWRKRV